MVLLQDEVAAREGIDDHLLQDLDVLELSTDDEVSLKIKRHSLVGKAITEKIIKLGPLRAILNKAWPLHDSLEVHELERNIFLFVFKDENDKARVLQQGPWSIMESHLMLKEWPEDATLEEIDFTLSEFWVQVHNLPLAYLTKKNAEKIASVFPGLIELDFDQDENFRWNGVLRMKVKVNIEDPLKTGFNLKRPGKLEKWVSFKYERLPDFCFSCGRLGHVAKECLFKDGQKAGDYGHGLKAIQPRQKTSQAGAGAKNSNKPSRKTSVGETAREDKGKSETLQFSLSKHEKSPSSSDHELIVAQPSVSTPRNREESLSQHLMSLDPAEMNVEVGTVEEEKVENVLENMELGLGPYGDPWEESRGQEPNTKEMSSLLGKRGRPNDMDLDLLEVEEKLKKQKAGLISQINRWVYETQPGMWDLTLIGPARDNQLLCDLFGHEKAGNELESNLISTWEVSVKGKSKGNRSNQYWFCTFVYGHPKKAGRRNVWDAITELRGNNKERWCCMGEFNAISSQAEKRGGRPIDEHQAYLFNSFIQHCNLMEVEIQGGAFSWSNNRTEEDNIQERLDKILATVEWSDFFNNAQGWYEPNIASDHNPVFLSLDKIKGSKKRDFRCYLVSLTRPLQRVIGKKNCDVIMDILDKFKNATGQMVNFSKSAVYFSSNVNGTCRRDLRNKLSVQDMAHDIPNWCETSLIQNIKDGSLRCLMNCSVEKRDVFVSNQSLSNNFWRKVWGLKSVPKVRNFIWRACKNIISTRENLVRRRHGRDSSCLRCGEEVESLEHIMFFCPFAQATWKLSHFSYSPRREGFTSFKNWWDKVACTFADFGSFSSISLISYLCWNIWKARNAFLFEGQSGEPMRVWNNAWQEFLEFMEKTAKVSPQQMSSFGSTPWQLPPNDSIKINCDAAFDKATGETGLAAVCRDHNGAIVDGISCVAFADSVDVAEALAVRMACKLALHRGWHKVIVESDNQALIHRLNNQAQKSRWDSTAVEVDIKKIASAMRLVSFVYVNRICHQSGRLDC
ncbi:Endonuclease/exonuclease/phosphatase [Corchorus olitorius]|uniref:Endonuclease/exonuclease/phosphatase n=1 Tax=Corchorus olitorius TaxID=93759 RepID=A0A1R3G7Z9_9ROSI|nr:Endonuclease/exonuclease/phosphatase [Corchorus olitorius]